MGLLCESIRPPKTGHLQRKQSSATPLVLPGRALPGEFGDGESRFECRGDSSSTALQFELLNFWRIRFRLQLSVGKKRDAPQGKLAISSSVRILVSTEKLSVSDIIYADMPITAVPSASYYMAFICHIWAYRTSHTRRSSGTEAAFLSPVSNVFGDSCSSKIPVLPAPHTLIYFEHISKLVVCLLKLQTFANSCQFDAITQHC